MKYIVSIAILILLFACGGDKKQDAPNDILSCVNPPKVESRLDITLIHGEPADPKEWPASVYASMGNASCSATVVGERVLLIASHCVNNGGTASFKVNGSSFKSTCVHHPEYSRNATADWTLCLTDKPVLGVKYESINTDKSLYKLNDKLRLTGYGCIRPGGGGGNDGIFRIGEAKVTRLPSGTNYDIETLGGAALCYGDSGGAAYYEDKAKGTRVIVGVNSRGDIATQSYLPSVASDTFQDFAKKWATSNSQLICGIHNNAKNCRSFGCGVEPKAITGSDLVIKKGSHVMVGGERLSGHSYEWTPKWAVDDASIPNPYFVGCVTTKLKLKVVTECGVSEKEVTVTVK